MGFRGTRGITQSDADSRYIQQGGSDSFAGFASKAIGLKVTGDPFDRFIFYAGSIMQLGDGADALGQWVFGIDAATTDLVMASRVLERIFRIKNPSDAVRLTFDTAGGNLTISGGFSFDSSKGDFRRARQSEAIAAAATVTRTIAFDGSAFADTNYTPVVDVIDPNNDLRILDIESVAAGSVSVRIQNTNALNGRTGTICVIAIHD